MAVTSHAFRTNLRSLAGTGSIAGGGFTLSSARCVMGYDDLALNNTFRATLLTDGPYLSIRRATLSGYNPGVPTDGRYIVPCDLWIAAARGTDDTMVNIETFVEAIKTAWARYWLEWDYDPIDDKADPMIIHYVITASTIDP